MDIRFDGKTAVVTGAAKGLGRETALALADSGADLVLGDMLDELGEKVAEEIRAKGRKAVYLHCDVTNVEQCEALAAAAGENLDILVNVAGISCELPLLDAPQKDIQRVMDVNAIGSSNILRAALKYMIPKKAGRIVLFSSTAMWMNSTTFPHYNMSKAAVGSLVISAAKTVAPYGITVNGILPGIIRTDMWNGGLDTLAGRRGTDQETIWNAMVKNMIPMGVPQEPIDIANATLFFCSDQARYVTGQLLGIDGGAAPTL